MKKLSIIVVVLAILCMFCFAGCIMQPGVAQDLGSQDTGYEFEVYPTVEFNYKIKDDFIVHISNISVSLVEKKEINTNDTIEGRFTPYTTLLEVSGYTDAKYAGTSIYIYLYAGLTTNIMCNVTIAEDGTFYASKETNNLLKSDIIYFNYIAI